MQNTKKLTYRYIIWIQIIWTDARLSLSIVSCIMRFIGGRIWWTSASQHLQVYGLWQSIKVESVAHNNLINVLYLLLVLRRLIIVEVCSFYNLTYIEYRYWFLSWQSGKIYFGPIFLNVTWTPSSHLADICITPLIGL